MNKKIEIQEGIAVEEMKFTLRNDYAFKKVFGNQNNKEPLIELLSLILGISKECIENVIIENPFLENEFYDEKKGILDLKLSLSNGDKINIEMQNKWEHHFIKRLLYYWSKRYIEDIKGGEDYYSLKPCISINFLNQSFPYNDKIHSKYRILETQDYTELENVLEIHFLDMTKLSDETLTELERWLLFIKTDQREVREMLARDNVAMTYANEVITNFYTDLRERRKYEAAERYVLDRNSLWNDGIREGISVGRAEGISVGRAEGISVGRAEGISVGRAEGISQGIVQRNFEIARNMKRKGFSLEEIMEMTDLGRKDLESL